MKLAMPWIIYSVNSDTKADLMAGSTPSLDGILVSIFEQTSLLNLVKNLPMLGTNYSKR